MAHALTAAIATRLEKAASDNGFDQPQLRVGDWLAFTSSHAPVTLWLTSLGEGLFLAAFSLSNVVRALSDHGTAFSSPLPAGAVGARGVVDIAALHALVRRAFQLSRALPNELLNTFERQTANLPRSTEVERLVVQRVGQDVFRAGLLDYWDGRCAISGLAVPGLLRASHIKPWATCADDAERLDVFNGLLLAVHYDALFDGGYITVADNGAVIVSDALDDRARDALGLSPSMRVRAVADAHRAYLAWHRTHEFECFGAVERRRDIVAR